MWDRYVIIVEGIRRRVPQTHFSHFNVTSHRRVDKDDGLHSTRAVQPALHNVLLSIIHLITKLDGQTQGL